MCLQLGHSLKATASEEQSLALGKDKIPPSYTHYILLHAFHGDYHIHNIHLRV